MPEKPRRRKNNKNRRKNTKNNKIDINKNNIDDNQTNAIASCSESEKNTNKESCQGSVVETKENENVVAQRLISVAPPEVSPPALENLNNVDKIHKKEQNEDLSLSQSYIVETPEQVSKAKHKLDDKIKSKSCDNDDSPTIVEITEESNVECDKNIITIDSKNALISSDESNVEWENVNELNLPEAELIESALSSNTIPLNTAHCQQTKSLSPEEETSLRNYLTTLNLSTNPSNLNSGDIKTEIEHIINSEIKYRLRKKGLADDNLYTRAGLSRSLAVIDEEGSGDSSKTSRRQSYLSDKKSDTEELEDEVFELKQKQSISKHLIPQQCFRVDAKLKEPEISEARGDWTIKTIEKMTGAELVYLTDSSSSTSSIYDANDDNTGNDTDASVRIITPTIEVTDTETLLSNSYVAESNDRKEEHLNNSDAPTICQTFDKIVESKEDLNSKSIDNTKSHEIVVLGTENIKTNLTVKDLEQTKESQCISSNTSENVNVTYDNVAKNIPKPAKEIDEYDLKIKVLKCELNNAINNLIKEVTDSETDSLKDIIRQDSSSSLDSSQCTAKYNPTYSSLNDVSNIINDETNGNLNKENIETNSSHVKDVLQSVSIKPPMKVASCIKTDPDSLKDMCLKKITYLPFGHKILEELANVSEQLQKSVLSTSSKNVVRQDSLNTTILQNEDVSASIKMCNDTTLQRKENRNVPPPIKPRRSSLKKNSDEHRKGTVQTQTNVLYECLSPSQKMLMEKTNTVVGQDDTMPKVDKAQENVSNVSPPTYSKQINLSTKQGIDLSMKSQTGSRLLALLMDSSNKNKSAKSSIYDRTLGEVSHKESFSKRALEEIDSANFSDASTSSIKNSSFSSKHFKPIPPPKPRKLSSYSYESDDNTAFREKSFQSMRNSKKYFHYSTGNLSEEIESDISSIQNMHRYCNNLRDVNKSQVTPRRPSLPKDLCEQQMEYIRQKEIEVDAEIRRLEQEKNKLARNRGPRAPMITEKESVFEAYDSKYGNFFNKDVSCSTSQGTINSNRRRMSSLFSSSQEELLREKMYSEYVNEIAEREQRKQQKVIKITKIPGITNISKSMPVLADLDPKVNNPIEQEFISKARERWFKLGIKDPETEDETENRKNVYREPKIIEHKIKVIEAGEEKDVKKLPNHMQEFVKFTVNEKDNNKGGTETVMIAPTFKARSSSPAIWRPGAPSPAGGEAPSVQSPSAPPPPPPPVWTPSSNTTSPQTPRKSYRPVHFEETPPPRRKFGNSDQNGCTSGSESEGRLRTSQSAPATGLNTLGSTSRLPRAQNPTVTLLQKAREGQIPRGPSNTITERDPRLPRDRPSPPRGDPVHALRKEYASEGEGERSDYERSQKMNDTKKKIEGIGPITKDGMPVALRSEVKDPSRWYKKMYDTIHKNKFDEDFVTIRYKNRRGEPQRPSSNRSQYAYFDPRSGYLSEPEGGLRFTTSTWSDAYDSDVTSGPRRRTASVQEERRFDDGSPYLPNNKYSTLASGRARQEVYKNQPGRIEDYVPGKSSVIDKEAKQQNESSAQSQSQPSPKEKKDLTSAILSKSNMARALKESGYESDSTLIFRRREDTEAPLSPAERRAAYRDLQAGGEPPIRGFRSPAPPRTESPSRRYVESDVNIHYRCPVRHDPLPLVPERELARQQAEHMKRLYREQRRNKYLQELQDMQNRRHQDNFMPSQKTIVPLNRYDEAEKIIAKALYTFNGQTTRELSFRKGDIINVRRQIDSNWYEGEVHGKVGLFPYNYVELLKGDGAQTLKKPTVVEGRARAKFDFTAQTNLELPLKKGEVVVLTRRIDHNWWEGRNGNKTGIFPDSYVTILQEPSQSKPEPQPILSTSKPVASPAAHGLLNGVDKRSMGAHRYTPQLNSPALSNAPPADIPLQGYITKSTSSLSASERGYGPPTGAGVDLNNTEPLYVDTNAEAVPYRAMYKYRPQNPDELELNEGDTVYVLEKCDDGWYVGSSQRTGRFGTFPGNYVERI